jgi:hypothetical protein
MGVTTTLGAPTFTAEDVTNLAQVAAFIAQVCTDAGHSVEGLNTAGILGDLATRITRALPLNEQLRLSHPPVEVAKESNGR